jgi:hypothetical protein
MELMMGSEKRDIPSRRRQTEWLCCTPTLATLSFHWLVVNASPVRESSKDSTS